MQNNNHKSKSPLERINDFYLFCSAAELSMLPPEEKETYITIGRLVVFNVTIAGLTGSFTVASIAGVPMLSVIGIAGGVLWARGIFAIDRPLLRMSKEPNLSAARKIAKAFPRLVLASLLSMTVAIPVETWIFRDSVKTFQIEKLNKEIHNLTNIKNIEDKKRHRLDPVTRRVYIDPQVVKNVKNYEEQIVDKINRIKAIETNATGLLEMAFTEQVRTNWEVALSHWSDGLLHFFIISLFFGIETLPFIYKLFILPYDSYDNAFNTWRKSKMEADSQTIPAREQKKAMEEITILSSVSGDTERLEKMAQKIKDIRDEVYEREACKYYEAQVSKEFPREPKEPNFNFTKKSSKKTAEAGVKNGKTPASVSANANGNENFAEDPNFNKVANGHVHFVEKPNNTNNWHDFMKNIPNDPIN